MTGSIRTHLGLLSALVILSSIFVVSANHESVMAVGENFGPNPQNVSRSGGISPTPLGYAVSTANYINARTSNIKIYSKNPRIYVAIAAADVCDGEVEMAGIKDLVNHSGDQNGKFDNVGFGAQMIDYQLNGGTGAVQTSGNKRTTTYCMDERGEVQFPDDGSLRSGPRAATTKILTTTSNRKLVGSPEWYVFDLDAQSVNTCGGPDGYATRCFYGSFRVKVLNYNAADPARYGDGTDIVVSQEQNNIFAIAPGWVGGARDDPTGTPTYFNYDVHFGADCNITTAGAIKTIKIHDDDNYQQPYVQPNDQPFNVQVERRPRDLSAGWSSVPFTSITADAPLPRKNDLGNNRWELGTNGSRNNIYLDFRMHPQYTYRLQIYHFYINNNIQYAIPYPSVWGEGGAQCQIPTYPEVVMPSEVIIGDPIEPQFTATNGLPADAGYDGSTEYIRKMWYANNADGTIDAGETVIQSDGTTWQGPAALDDGNPAIIPSATFNHIATGSSRYICASLELKPHPITTSLVEGQPNPAFACTQVGKYPSIQVQGGDVRSGGVFRNVSGCKANRLGSVIGHNYGNVNRGSKSEFAVLASGSITDFGSASMTPSSPVGSNQLFFGSRSAYSPALGSGDGYFYFDSTRNVSAPVSNWPVHCLPNLDSVYPWTPGQPINNIQVAGNVSPAALGSGQLVYEFSPNPPAGFSRLRINQAQPIQLTNGQRISIRVKGPDVCSSGETYTVQIENDITASGSYANAAGVPWFSLITEGKCVRIVVEDNVKELYGLFASEGNIYTCAGDKASRGGQPVGFDGTNATGYSAALALSVADCTEGLNVRGAVITGEKLHSYRTYGDGSIPAEVVNLIPEFSISDYHRARQSNVFRTDLLKELPPRF